MPTADTPYCGPTSHPLLALLNRDGLRDALAPVLGTRPSREAITAWESMGMPVIRLGARTIRYDLADVIAWVRAQTVTRTAPTLTRTASQRIVSDPRLRH